MQKNLLRTLVLSSVLCLMSIVSHAQWVSIPDSNFGNWLNTNGYVTCLQGNSTVGWQMDTTCNAVVNDTSLYIQFTNIKNLNGIQYFDNLKSLTGQRNPLMFSLYTPVLPATLKTFSMEAVYSSVTNLPIFPQGLEKLTYTDHNLTNLPTLPPALKHLNISFGLITSLPSLPSGLKYLNCNSNLITSLPILPASLTDLYCRQNHLSSLPELPDSLSHFNCAYNPNLFCLPQLKKIKHFDFSVTGITCLPNYPESNSTCDPALSSVSLCDVFNTYDCDIYWNMRGKIYADSNANCLLDTGEKNYSNLKVQLYQNGILQQQQNTYSGGLYSFVTVFGTYTYSIDTANLPLSVACPDSFYYTSNITALDSFDADMNFGLRCKPGFDLAAQSISAVGFRPANVTVVDISAGDATNFYNEHCAEGISGSVQLIINGSAHYSSAAIGALTPTSIVNDTITWSIADFGAVDFFTAFNINVATDTTAVLGSQICFTLIVNPIAGDNDGKNNILTHCFTVVGSFDPNEKEVYPAGNIDTATHWLTYTIHFQNTGTAEAQHIYVTDTLDSSIDAASFQLLAYSHQPMVQLKGNNLRFNFPNINLPDSNTSEPLSHGYVQYKVKLKDNLPIGTNINNTAFIYFDFNAPVVTNTTSNTIALATSVANLGLRNADFGLNPNPTNNSVVVSIDESMIGSNLMITDITGRQVTAVQLQTENVKLQTDNLSQGIYFVTIETKTGSVTKKLVKQ